MINNPQLNANTEYTRISSKYSKELVYEGKFAIDPKKKNHSNELDSIF